MLIQDFLSLAREGELRNINLSDEAYTETILGYINLGLIELYKRFPLKTKEFLIANTSEGTFTLPDDCMQVIEAYGSIPTASGDPLVIDLPLNDVDSPYSVYIPTYNQVQIPFMENDVVVSIIYAATPPYLTMLDVTNNIPLPIPDQLIEALLNYVGYRAHGSMDSNVNSETTTHYQRFENSCKRVELLGLYIFDGTSAKNRLYERGFV